MVFSSGLAHASPPKQRTQAPAADETTPLLPGRRTSAVLAPSSSGASSLTISSLDDSDEFVPWYADVERNAANKAAAAASIREVAPTTAPVPPPKTPEEEEAASSSVHYIDKADPEVAKAVVSAYVRALTYSLAVSLFCSLLALGALSS